MALTTEQLEKMIIDLQKTVDILQNKILHQTQIIPGTIKSRHISEGVKYIQAGLAADLPSAEIPAQGASIYYAYDTKKLYIYNNGDNSWDEVALT